MTTRRMTKPKLLTYEFIKAYIKIHGIPPSYQTIAEGRGLKSRSSVHRMIHWLEAEGYLKTTPGKFYSIKILDRDKKAVETA